MITIPRTSYRLRGTTATSLLTLLLLLFIGMRSFAGTFAGTVTHLSGPLFVTKAGGATKVLARNSVVEEGDTISTEKGTYARIKFSDNSEITLRPNTRITITRYSYEQAKPKEDNAVFGLVKGGLRAVTGAVGKRGNQDSYRMNTPVATIGIRGTVYEIRLCRKNEENDCGVNPDGLYLFVFEGNIVAGNDAGSKNIGASQYGYAADVKSEPQILPGKPAIDFSIPPISPGGGQEDYGRSEKAPSDCVVR